ncbi:DUF4274 domain-containing protein [Herpetosiphon giganteus]|uniref:DUF4274 domain-containing protein n=1 Tax=Herpetosiphon giganteus TaxID=2029754 RepID=UPI001958F7B0|nr:DUF4274 domain-containing protein [Herpetosiphon giganteus]MBM7846332.1 hypothetical protein [Herpetosiphon giganteus]
MAPQLTKSEAYAVLQVLEFDADYRQLTKPLQWHQMMLQWNWDGNLEPIWWIIQQPNCDFGTALLIFWRANAGYYYQYPNREALIADRGNPAIYDLLKQIELNYLNGFYQNQAFGYDPTNEDGDDFTQDYVEQRQQAIPEGMVRPSPGPIIKYQALMQSTIRPLTSQEAKRVAKKLSQAWQILTAFNPQFTPQSASPVIVQAIAECVEQFRQSLSITQKISHRQPILALGWLWAEQLCQAYAWTWACRSSRITRSIGVISPDKDFMHFPPNLISYLVKVRREQNQIYPLFERLATIEATSDFRDAYSSGWLSRTASLE